VDVMAFSWPVSAEAPHRAVLVVVRPAFRSSWSGGQATSIGANRRAAVRRDPPLGGLGIGRAGRSGEAKLARKRSSAVVVPVGDGDRQAAPGSIMRRPVEQTEQRRLVSVGARKWRAVGRSACAVRLREGKKEGDERSCSRRVQPARHGALAGAGAVACSATLQFGSAMPESTFARGSCVGSGQRGNCRRSLLRGVVTAREFNAEAVIPGQTRERLCARQPARR
jgi:hypothetical protein